MVGKSDFNENPVVSLDLDLDFDLGFVNFEHFKENYKCASNDIEVTSELRS